MTVLSNAETRIHARCSRLLLLAAIVSLFAACGPKAGPVVLSPNWPQTVEDYEAVNAKWTRTGEIYRGIERVLHAVAIFKSPEWRTSRVDRRVRLERQGPAVRNTLLAQERQQSEAAYEVTLLVSTYNRRENDLNKGERSIWKLALIDDRGNRVAPFEVERDRRPRDVIRSDFPLYGDFAQAYIVRFRKGVNILRSDAKHFSLRIASVRGATELFWRTASN